MSDPADHGDPLYRSHFLNADQLADEHAGDKRPDIEPVDKEVDNGWLNIRVGEGEWASVRDFSRIETDRTQQGRIHDTTPPAEWSERPGYSDPVADGMDPTAPDSPESQF